MRILILILSLLTIGACSSSPNKDATKEVTVTVPAVQQKAISTPAASKPFTPAKPMKCKYDTDCVVADSCVANKCKLGGNECRFRSDCPSPRGTCVANKCEFH
jgi:hypothetical protein